MAHQEAYVVGSLVIVSLVLVRRPCRWGSTPRPYTLSESICCPRRREHERADKAIQSLEALQASFETQRTHREALGAMLLEQGLKLGPGSLLPTQGLDFNDSNISTSTLKGSIASSLEMLEDEGELLTTMAAKPLSQVDLEMAQASSEFIC